jgi:hypothetical protein
MSKTELTCTAQQVPLPDSNKLDYGGAWIIVCAGVPVRSEGRNGSLITFATKELAEENFEWARAAIARGDSLRDIRNAEARKRDEERGIKPPPPAPSIPAGAKAGR